MDLLQLIVIIAMLGVILWAINTYGAPYIDPKFLRILNVVAVVGVIIFILKVFGVFDYASGIRVGQLGGPDALPCL